MNFKFKLSNYLRQPTTLIGIACFIGACVGKMLNVLTDNQATALVTSSIPLWISEKKDQIKTEIIAAEIIHNLPNLQNTTITHVKKGVINDNKNISTHH